MHGQEMLLAMLVVSVWWFATIVGILASSSVGGRVTFFHPGLEKPTTNPGETILPGGVQRDRTGNVKLVTSLLS